MSLDYNYSKVDFSFVKNDEDRDYAESMVASAAWLCMALDLPGPTTKNIEEFMRRYKVYVSMFDTFFRDGRHRKNLFSEKFIREVLCDRFTTNVAPKSATKWNNYILSYAGGEGDRRLNRYTDKFYGMAKGSDDD